MKLVASTILIFLLGTMFVSLFHMSIGMDMSQGMNDCPFMSHGGALCAMDAAAHVGAWQAAFQTALPSIVLLLVAAGTVLLAVLTAPHLLCCKPRPTPVLLQQLRERTYSFSYRPLQELFSDGILHPKLF